MNVQTYDDFFLPETMNHFPFDEFDYIVDAVDTVTACACILKRWDLICRYTETDT